jgi:16S rRNA processing protein RimM
MIVRPVENSIDKEERLIPFVKEQVIKQVDLDENIIRVDWEKDF